MESELDVCRTLGMVLRKSEWWREIAEQIVSEGE